MSMHRTSGLLVAALALGAQLALAREARPGTIVVLAIGPDVAAILRPVESRYGRLRVRLWLQRRAGLLQHGERRVRPARPDREPGGYPLVARCGDRQQLAQRCQQEH